MPWTLAASRKMVELASLMGTQVHTRNPKAQQKTGATTKKSTLLGTKADTGKRLEKVRVKAKGKEMAKEKEKTRDLEKAARKVKEKAKVLRPVAGRAEARTMPRIAHKAKLRARAKHRQHMGWRKQDGKHGVSRQIQFDICRISERFVRMIRQIQQQSDPPFCETDFKPWRLQKLK